MDRDDIIDRLRQHKTALRRRGIAHAALFGSRARGDDRPDSDTDLLVEIDPGAGLTLFDYAGLKKDIAVLFNGPVDVVDRDSLKPRLNQHVVTDAIYAF